MGSLKEAYKYYYAITPEEKTTALNVYKKHHELIETSSVNASTLVKEEVFAKIIEGADERRCMRDVFKATTFDMPTPTYRFILHETVNSTLPEVPPNSQYPVAENESYRAVTYTATKYGELPTIEKELVEDSMFDVIEMRLRDEGRKAENTLNQKCIDALIANANDNVSYVDTAPIASIRRARETMRKNGFEPDVLIMTPDMEADLVGDPHYRFDYGGEKGNFRTGDVGNKIMGLTPYVLTINSANGSFGGAIKGVLAESSKMGGLGIKNDITLEKFEDPKNDLINLKVSTRFDVQAWFKKAVANLSGTA